MDQSLEKLIAKETGETSAEYSAFLFFASLPPKERISLSSVKKAAAYCGLSEYQISNAKKAYRWIERAEMVDAHNWMVENQKRQDVLSADNQEFIEQNREVKHESLKISRQMLNVATKLLSSAELVDDVIQDGFIETKDGRMVPTHTTIKMKAKISDIPRLVETAVKVSRLAADLPTDIIFNDISLGTDLSNLSDEELQALRQKNHQTLIEKGAVSKLETGNDLIG